MRRGGGKLKGGAFERKVCVALSLWVSRDKERDLFWRSAMSGGRATVSAKSGKKLRRQAGDISATAAEGHVLTNAFFIECKHHKNLDLLPFVFNRQRGLMSQFWRTACKEAKKHDRKPMLIAKQNFLPTLVVMKVNDLPIEPLVVVGKRCGICFLDDMLKAPFDRGGLT